MPADTELDPSSSPTSPRAGVQERLHATREVYDPDGRVDLERFTGGLAGYGLAAATLALAVRARGGAPERYAPTDLLLGGLAAHKFSRLLARGSVTSPVRAPFTEFAGAAGSAEHAERARDGSGARHTVGELLTCPFCLGVWTSTAYVATLAVAPRAARAWAAVFSVSAISDALQLGYARLRGD